MRLLPEVGSEVILLAHSFDLHSRHRHPACPGIEPFGQGSFRRAFPGCLSRNDRLIDTTVDPVD